MMSESESIWDKLDDERIYRAVALFVPFFYYVSMVRIRYTFGDGPELMTAAKTFGISHPSGYPLWTLLAMIPGHIPWPSAYWHTSVWLSALPTAATCLLMYEILRGHQAHRLSALFGALLWGLGWQVIYQATRVEVYALHCLFLAAALWATMRFGQTGALKFAYGAVLAVCLGLTNHLTMAFMIVPIMAGLVAHDRKIIQPIVALKFAGIAAACAAIYLYLPLAAYLNDGYTITWNDPETFERFWFHVTGEEYSIFRNYDNAWGTIEKFGATFDGAFFPFALIIAAMGAVEWGFRDWRTLMVGVLFFGSNLAYIASYTINDIATYYTGMYVLIALAIGLGIDWIALARLDELGKKYSRIALVILTLGAVAWLGYKGYHAHTIRWQEALARDMAEQVTESLDEPALIFTAVDGHSFPLWHERYVNHPDARIVPLDRVMFRLANKKWYRDFHRETYPWIEWPSEEEVKRGRWESWLVRNNPDINFYAMLEREWRHPGSHAVLEGWHARLERTPPPDGKARWAKHIYFGRVERTHNGVFIHDSRTRYPAGAYDISCIAEWNKNPDLVGRWIFEDPDGNAVVDIDNHGLPEDTGASWETLRRGEQKPGIYTCRIEVDGVQPLVREVELY